jgi:DNA invertase Pin-like site-specific DNA recombinase
MIRAGSSYGQIARQFHISRQRVHQIWAEYRGGDKDALDKGS